MAERLERQWDAAAPSRWIDTGSGGGYEPRGTVHDTRNGFSPAVLVLEVKALLEARGITLAPDDRMMFVAGIAAGDLLRALGVRPETAPMRPQRP